MLKNNTVITVAAERMDGLIAWSVKLAGEKSDWLRRWGWTPSTKMPVMVGRFMIKYLDALAANRQGDLHKARWFCYPLLGISGNSRLSQLLQSPPITILQLQPGGRRPHGAHFGSSTGLRKRAPLHSAHMYGYRPSRRPAPSLVASSARQINSTPVVHG